MKRMLKLLGVLLLLTVLVSTTVHFVRSWGGLPRRPAELEIVAHRGVAQTFPLDNLTDETCTAARIYPPTHHFLENTIPSIAEAFKDGATMVEMDIHPTSDGRMVVFHDWGLDCRTNGHGVTHDHSLAELKQLDIAFGYTADGGKTYPLRGTGVGMMPVLEEVFAAFPQRKLILHQKDRSVRTAEILAKIVNQLPPERRRLLYWYGDAKPYARLQQLAPEITRQFPFAGEMKQCAKSELWRMGFGDLPQACQLRSMVLPVQYLWLVPGWPNDFLRKAAAAQVPFYVMEVDSVEAARKLAQLPIRGIMTNRIDLVGPVIAGALDSAGRVEKASGQ